MAFYFTLPESIGRVIPLFPIPNYHDRKAIGHARRAKELALKKKNKKGIVFDLEATIIRHEAKINKPEARINEREAMPFAPEAIIKEKEATPKD